MTRNYITKMFQRAASRLFLASLLPCLLASVAFAGTVSGTVTNGTTGKAADGVEVILIQLQGTMQPVANTKTDAQGHYQLSSDILGTAPMLLRAVYRGVNYHEPVPVGTTNVDMQVFEPTDKATAINVTAHFIVLQPNGTDLTVGEEFNIANNTNPPVAYYRSDGSFLFKLPKDAKITDASAGIASGMPVIQTPVDKGNGTQAIDYPFRPGDSEVRITYHVPYPSNQTTLQTVSPYPANQVGYAAPPTLHVDAAGFTPGGTAQGYNLYLRQSVPANAELTALVSGTAPPPSNADATATGDNSQNPSVNSHVDSGDTAASASITTMPARLDGLKWILVAGFAAIFALGAVFIVRRPQAVLAGPETVDPPAPAVPAPAAPKPSAPPPVGQPAVRSVSDLDNAVSGSLDQLKDALFRLELRHQAGTISADDYARERQRIDQKLRDLVQG
jgi:hypothetical protein